MHSLREEGEESQVKKQNLCVWQMISSQSKTPWDNVCPPVSVSATDKARYYDSLWYAVSKDLGYSSVKT